ncbi:flagellar biosynthesis anti-sigma factor FlgM [Izhakiella capsodis]|uniref:Negative regulator of flagellin synthesis n=1 Tax=Izhakiella capsodis TaxID=1367852 RepID=A0A1I4YB87_9GAMM|nr:flagellar biosynthesis anti-sigma factor FlgM [Izhakiella capsodis]SFN35331.1 flagellar biosynthesis anti-sigma factor FlgM [Izhakiella capsodis]
MKILTSLLIPVPALQNHRKESESVGISEKKAEIPQQQLHTTAKELLTARQQLQEEPEIDQQKVAACKAELQAGNLTVDTDELARAMMDFHRHGR